MPVRLITAPASEPVTLAEAKRQLRLETADDDDFVTSLIAVAREFVEGDTDRQLVTQTWELVQGSFRGVDTLELGYRGGRTTAPLIGYGAGSSYLSAPANALPWIELPKGVTASITSIKYIDADGVQQTLSPSVYTVDNVTVPARVMLAYGQAWPDTRAQWDAVVIRYVVGSAVADVAPSLKQAIRLLLSSMYENRVPVVANVPTAYDALVAPLRIIRL